MKTNFGCGSFKVSILATVLGVPGCGSREAPNENVARSAEALNVPQAVQALSCSSGAYILNYNFPNPADWERIKQAPVKPAFVVVDDHASDTTPTPPDSQATAPGWFHNPANLPNVKVLKYIPMNYGHETGNNDTTASGCTIRDDTQHFSGCNNNPTNGHPYCGAINIQTRIANALASGFDGVFFDEAPAANGHLPPGVTAEDVLQYILDCGNLVKNVFGDPNKLVIINPGSYPQTLGVFSPYIDIVALENYTVAEVVADGRIQATGIPPERWLAIQKNIVNEPGLPDQPIDGNIAANNLLNFRSRGGFWYYGTQQYGALPPWMEDITANAGNRGRPECSGTLAPASCGLLNANEGLIANTDQKSLAACAGGHVLTQHPNGNLAIQGGGTFWAANAFSSAGSMAVMQGDGNFVLYRDYNRNSPYWATNTYGNPGAFLRLQSDGNLVVYNSNLVPIWSILWPHWPTSCGRFTTNEGLNAGMSLTSCNGAYSLFLQNDGNLVLRQGANVLFATNTAGWGNLIKAFMQGDGNFRLYKADDPGAYVWDTGTQGNDGARLELRDDGSLVVVSTGNVELWRP